MIGIDLTYRHSSWQRGLFATVFAKHLAFTRTQTDNESTPHRVQL